MERTMPLNTIIAVPALAGLLALSAAGAASAAPPPPSFQFGIQLGDNGDYDPSPYESCETDDEIILDVRSHGYRNLRLIDGSDDTLTFDAARRGRFYELEVDACSGDILSRTRIFHY
jgi:hypothetical protein